MDLPGSVIGPVCAVCLLLQQSLGLEQDWVGGSVKLCLALSGSHASLKSCGWTSPYTRQWEVGEGGAGFRIRGQNSGKIDYAYVSYKSQCSRHSKIHRIIGWKEPLNIT